MALKLVVDKKGERGMFDEVIQDCKGYIERDGFLFTNVTGPANIYDGLYIRNIKDDKLRFRNFPIINNTLKEHIELINKYQMDKAMIFASDIEFLRKVLSLKYLFLTIFFGNTEFNYAPLYDMPSIKSLVVNDSNWNKLAVPIDYSKINGLELVNIAEEGHLNFEKIETLKTLGIGCWKKKDLKDLFVSKELDTLRMIQCGMKSLDGIENSDAMQCLYLHYNRSLKDIKALGKVSKTLKALRIENCPKIEDFSVLEELENLELLELTGRNELPNLNFIKKLPNLKTFLFDMNVLDGDLTPCLDLSYVYSRKNRKHYNVKNKDMPKGKYVWGNEDIEMWRRLEGH